MFPVQGPFPATMAGSANRRSPIEEGPPRSSRRTATCCSGQPAAAWSCGPPALTKLGFDGEDLLDVDVLEWPFQYEEARPLPACFCSCLRPSNLS